MVSEQDLHKSKPVKFPALLGGGLTTPKSDCWLGSAGEESLFFRGVALSRPTHASADDSTPKCM